MERHITKRGQVLDKHGHIVPGWSERAVCTYRRDAIRAPFYRIKEWDYYQVSDGRSVCSSRSGTRRTPGRRA